MRPDPELEFWPAELRDLVERHGAAKVNDAGLTRLGYPAILCTHEYERREVRAALADHSNPEEKIVCP